MKPSFRIVGLPRAQFEPLFSLNEKELSAKGARRVIADAKPGFPCRIGLVAAEIGETVILLRFTHHDADSSYGAGGGFFVRQSSEEAKLAAGEIPELVVCRTMSVRAYNK